MGRHSLVTAFSLAERTTPKSGNQFEPLYVEKGRKIMTNKMVNFECSYMEGPTELQTPDYYYGAIACASIDGFPEDPDEEGEVICVVWLTSDRKFIVDWHDNGYRMNDTVLENIKTAKMNLLNVFGGLAKTEEPTTTVTLSLTERELEVLKNYAKQFTEKPDQPPMFALKSVEATDRKPVSLDEAESEGDAIFEYPPFAGGYETCHSIEEVVLQEIDRDDVRFLTYEDSCTDSYAEYLEMFGINPDDVSAFVPIYKEKTLALGFSESEMPAVQEDLSNHIFGEASIKPEYGTSFGHSAGDFAPMTSALRKIGEALLKK